MINGGRHPAWLDALMAVISASGAGGLIFWLGLGFGFMGARGSARFTATLGLGALLLTVILGEGLLKHLVQRPRPWDVLPMDSLHHLGPLPHSTSFPSVHTMAAFAVAILVGRRHRRWFWPLLILATLMGYSRIYLGDHFPLDVVGGASAGTLLALGVIAATRYALARLKEQQSLSMPSGPCGAGSASAKATEGDTPELRIVTFGTVGLRPGEALADWPVPIYTMRRDHRGRPALPVAEGEVYEPVEVFLPRRR